MQCYYFNDRTPLHNIIPYHTISFTGLQSDVDHFINAGADRVLLKPLDMAEFKEAMRGKKL